MQMPPSKQTMRGIKKSMKMMIEMIHLIAMSLQKKMTMI